MNKNLLKQYARLVAGVGINVQKGQTVVVRCPVDCADFGRALCAACFELGAKVRVRLGIEEDLVQIQLDWLQKFIENYPKMAGYVRFIYTDDAQETIETAFQKDLAGYGDRTFILYGKLVTDIAQAGGNLTYDIMNNMACLYGYAGVEDAERQL